MDKWYGDENSSLMQLVAKSMPDKFNNLTILEKNALTRACIGYILHVYNYQEMRRVLNPVIQLSAGDARRLRQNLVSSFATALALKQIIFMLVSQQLKLADAPKLLHESGMPMADVAVLQSISEMRLTPAIKIKISQLEEIPILAPAVVRRNCGIAVDTIRKSTERFVRYKLQFVYKHNQIGADDLVWQLLELAIHTYYYCTPFYSDVHRLNAMRTKVHNEGIRLIQFYKAQKRERLSDYTFVQKILTLDTARPWAVFDDDENKAHRLMFESLHREGKICSETNLIDTMRSIERFVEGGPPGRKILVQLLTLQSDDESADIAEFIEFAKRRLHLRLANCAEDIFSKIGQSEYYKLIAEYLWTTRDVVASVAQDLKRIFCGETCS